MGGDAPTPPLVVYWPQRRLHAALRVLASGKLGGSMDLELVGFGCGRGLCVVDIVRGSADTDDGIDVVGRISSANGGAGSSRRRGTGRAHALVAFSSPEDASTTTADAMDAALCMSVVCAKTGATLARPHIVLYDAVMCANGCLSRGLAALPETSELRPALELICAHLEAKRNHVRSRGGVFITVVEYIGYYGCLVPWEAVAAVARVLDKGLSLPVLGSRVKDHSQFLAILSHHAQAVGLFPRRIRAIYRGSGGGPTASDANTGVDLLNAVAYALVDYALGVLLVTIVQDWVFSQFPVSDWTPISFLDTLRAYVVWLMGAPAGFKLNLPLASILGNGILLWFDIWEFVFVSLSSSSEMTAILHDDLARLLFAGIWRHMGASLQLSLISDVLMVTTWSSHWVYLYFTKLNAMQFGLLSSLWKLFLGKKKNVLRKRVDSCEYDANQLLLGTLLFTILVFLVTTNSVFFVYFGLVRLVIWICGLVLWIPIVAIRVVPFASIAHRFVFPLHRADSIRVEALPNPPASTTWVCRDVGASKRRTGDANDQVALRTFLLKPTQDLPQANAKLRVFLRPCSWSALLVRLHRYQTALRQRYKPGAVIQSALFGAHLPPVEISTLFAPNRTDGFMPKLHTTRKAKDE